MKYNTILTSKGTTTIPAEIRKKLGVKPGMYVSFTQNKKTGEYVLKRAQTIEEIRSLNDVALRQSKTAHKEYKNGNGFGQFIVEKYGKQQ